MVSLSALLQQKKPVVFDGAMGTELQRRGVNVSLPLWSARAIATAPEMVRAIHQDYIAAGARVLTANTFRTTTFTYQRAGLDVKTARETACRATCSAVSLARETVQSAAQTGILIAGSLAPVGDCYTPSDYPGRDIAQDTYKELAQWLATTGVDLLLLETHIMLEEAHIALETCRDTGLPVLVSYLIDEDMKLWAGASLIEAVKVAEGEGAQGIMINCVTLPIALKGVETLSRVTKLPYGVYANAGHDKPVAGGSINRRVADEQYAFAARHWHDMGASMIGGCCGTTPSTITAICQQLNLVEGN